MNYDLKKLILARIEEDRDDNIRDLEEMRSQKISMNSCGAGYSMGAIEVLTYLKEFIEKIELV